MKNFKLVENFITYESKNENYFKTRKSSIKADIIENHFILMAMLKNIRSHLSNDNSSLRFLLDSIMIKQKTHLENFADIESIIYQKGFKDYGVEGRMRAYAHQLMFIKNPLLQIDALMLRRHEKDFIIRKERQYFIKFNSLCNSLIKESRKKIKDPKEYNTFINLVLNYDRYFNEYYYLQVRIGTNDSDGLLQFLEEDYSSINALFDREKIQTVEIEDELDKKLKIYNLLLVGITFLLSVIFSIIYSNRISKIATNIKVAMNNYVLSGFTEFPKINNKTNIVEFDNISINFLKMSHEIDGYLNYFKVKVKERTAEIEKQKEEIELQKEQIQIQNNLLMNQKIMLSETNKNFTDSIEYAEKIQKALLPTLNVLKNTFRDFFIFYQPKDIVSGDFYWVEAVETPVEINKKPILEEAEIYSNKMILENHYPKTDSPVHKTVLFAVADCTGHGVPGAFMSIMGINHLNKIVKEQHITDPSKILDKLNFEIRNSLKQDHEHKSILKDGMDIGCCAIDIERMTLNYAGANTKLLLIRDNDIHEYKSSNNSIGLNPFVDIKMVSFRRIDIKLKKGDKLYLYSDGYQDQFGGRNNKKFKSKNLRQLLLSINNHKMADQLNFVKESFQSWKGETFQVDDITILGIEI
ncbi:MAG TPA: SpoIIE family protein phosphatase [Bacteroidia bacterium]|nr:SpoIIE family protein phosphatase [Bacteroidia bacterium]